MLAGHLSRITAWVGALFILFSIVLYLLSLKDLMTGNAIASTTRLKVAIIFTLVGLGLIFLQTIM
jgi:predicted Kef-type K+ transport protein